MIKKTIDDLAIFGGAPAYCEPLHVGRPNIGDRAVLFKRLNDMLDRRWLTNYGPYVQELEELIAAKVGVRHCIVVCNATIALEVVAHCLGLRGEVILPSFTFVATAHALKWLGITPVFCDVNPNTHNIDPVEVVKRITHKTTGILGVHAWGRGCDVAALQKIADAHQIKLFFDAAHAIGCSHRGQMIGNFGEAEVFSFHATKFINSFEGGAVVTNHDELADKARLMINFGFRGYDNVLSMGTNGKMSEASAAMGITGFESMDQFIAKNYENYSVYCEAVQGIPGVRLMQYDDGELSNYQYVIAEIDEKLTGLHRDMLLKILHAENILARRYFYPGCHNMEPYRTENPNAGSVLPKTEQLVKSVISFPNGTSIGADEIRTIAGILRMVIGNSLEVKRRLAS